MTDFKLNSLSINLYRATNIAAGNKTSLNYATF